jgi:ABC-2 type transport system ATP-binding protein
MKVDVAIEVKGLYKDFVLPHQKSGSVKNIFTNLFAFGNKTFETQHALKDISFEIKKGEFFGIVGRNGSGKSTLLKILAGIYQPTKGAVKTTGRIVPFIELGVGFNGELTGRENVYLNGALLGFSEKEISAKYQDIVDFAEIERFMDQKLKNYSSGMQVRLAFSVATVLAESDILLIDEVLAVGDADFQRKCFDYFKNIKKLNKTVIFVSHDMDAVREYCDRAILIEKSEIVASGSSDRVASKYSRMFMEKKHTDKISKTNSKRWGDKKIEYTTVNSLVNEKDNTVSITCIAKAHEDVDNPIFGFSIKTASGQALIGTNTQIVKQNIKFIKKNDSIELCWNIPNVFNDGNYFVEPAAVYNSGSSVADWWEEASYFEILKEQRTPYLFNPNIEVEIRK